MQQAGENSILLVGANVCQIGGAKFNEMKKQNLPFAACLKADHRRKNKEMEDGRGADH